MLSSCCSSLGKRDSANIIDRANNVGDKLSKLQKSRRNDVDLAKLEQQENAGTKRIKKEDEESDVEVGALFIDLLHLLLTSFVYLVGY